MTDIKQIYTSHQSLVGTVTPSVIRTVPFSLGGYAPSGKWYSPYNFGCYSSNQRLALACIFVYYTRFPWIAGSLHNHMIRNCPTTSQETFNDGYKIL